MRAKATLAGIAAVVTLLVGAVQADAYTTDLTRPIVFVHGFQPSGYPCPGYDENSYFGTAATFLQGRGWSGPMDEAGYYACDTNATDNIASYGSHSAYYASGHYTTSSGQVGHNQDADIRHLAYHLAWYIYDRYSSKGVTVELLTHSMGGLIARWMLYAEQSADPNFPPYLYVADVMAVAPPNGGSGEASLCTYTECTQMRANSTFLNTLNNSSVGQNPQGTGGTDWTVMGSACDGVVSESSALTMGAVHKVEYSSPCYSHSGYLSDTSTASDASVSYANPPSTTLTRWTSAPHALMWANNAMSSASW